MVRCVGFMEKGKCYTIKMSSGRKYSPAIFEAANKNGYLIRTIDGLVVIGIDIDHIVPCLLPERDAVKIVDSILQDLAGVV